MQLNTNTLVSRLRRRGDKVLRRELAGEMLTPLISSRAKTRLMPRCDAVRGGILRERVRLLQDSFSTGGKYPTDFQKVTVIIVA